jgi:hypothetical protein
MEENKDQCDEFGKFGEIAVKTCFICGKTILQKSSYGFVRQKDKPNFTPTGNGQYSINTPKTYLCLKCLLEGVYGVCKDKESINTYLDLYIKTAIAESLDK